MRSNSPKHLRGGSDGKWDTAGVLLDDLSPRDRIDFAEVFPPSPARPVEVEVGIGKGTFLLARAKSRPEVNLLGIEYARAYACYAADRLRRAGASNAKVLCADAEHVFRAALAEGSVWRVFVLFPDPWPKRKHHRRRLIQPRFLADVRRVLQPGGQLLIVTDHRDYFEHISKVLQDAEGFAGCDFPKLVDDEDRIVGTNFERKYVREGRSFYRAARMKYV